MAGDAMKKPLLLPARTVSLRRIVVNGDCEYEVILKNTLTRVYNMTRRPRGPIDEKTLVAQP